MNRTKKIGQPPAPALNPVNVIEPRAMSTIHIEYQAHLLRSACCHEPYWRTVGYLCYLRISALNYLVLVLLRST